MTVGKTRQGLASVCIGVIAVALGYLALQGSPLVETVGYVLVTGGLGGVLFGLALIAYGLLRE